MEFLYDFGNRGGEDSTGKGTSESIITENGYQEKPSDG